jgi:hypothetical protein
MKHYIKIKWKDDDYRVPHILDVEKDFVIDKDFKHYIEEQFKGKVIKVEAYTPLPKRLILYHEPLVKGGTPRDFLVLSLTTHPFREIEGITMLIKDFGMYPENEKVYDSIRNRWFDYWLAEKTNALYFEEFTEVNGNTLSVIELIVDIYQSFKDEFSMADLRRYKLERLFRVETGGDIDCTNP